MIVSKSNKAKKREHILIEISRKNTPLQEKEKVWKKQQSDKHDDIALKKSSPNTFLTIKLFNFLLIHNDVKIFK